MEDAFVVVAVVVFFFFTVSGCYRFDLDSHPGAVFIGLDSGHKMRSVIKNRDIKVLPDFQPSTAPLVATPGKFICPIQISSKQNNKCAVTRFDFITAFTFQAHIKKKGGKKIKNYPELYFIQQRVLKQQQVQKTHLGSIN